MMKRPRSARTAGMVMMAAGSIAGLFGRLGKARTKHVRLDHDDPAVQRHIWHDSTQRLGVRFTEKIRDHWRPGWLRPYRQGDDTQ